MSSDISMDLRYQEKIFKKYVSSPPKNIILNKVITTFDDKNLFATEQLTDSRIGLLIGPGMTVPRESFYPVFEAFPDLNILVYDKRAHGYSEGSVDISKCLTDNLMIAREWKRRLGLEALIFLGHSFEGMIGTLAIQNFLPPYDAFISAAAPINLKKAGGLIPKVLTKTSTYVYNCIRWRGNAHSRDEIVSYHRSLSPKKYSKNPKIVALRLEDIEAFNESMTKMPKLTDIIEGVDGKKMEVPPRFYYGGKDSRLGINNVLEGEYSEFREKAENRGMHVHLINDLSHRFNKIKNPVPVDRILRFNLLKNGFERDFAFSYNNKEIFYRIARAIDYFK